MRKEDAALEREILVDQIGDPVFFRLSQTMYPIAYLLGRKPKRESCVQRSRLFDVILCDGFIL